MANEGSTKPTYSALEAENLRVRGLLQRLEWAGSDDGADCCPMCGEYPRVGVHEPDCELRLMLAHSGAESADIGKLDTADKKTCDEFRGDDPKACSTCGRPIQDHGSIVLPTERMTREEFRKRYPGSAETGGEKAVEQCPCNGDATFPGCHYKTCTVKLPIYFPNPAGKNEQMVALAESSLGSPPPEEK